MTAQPDPREFARALLVRFRLLAPVVLILWTVGVLPAPGVRLLVLAVLVADAAIASGVLALAVLRTRPRGWTT